jgi:AmmeMemoRadiSam system protein B
MNVQTRRPAVAGTFYPADPRRLGGLVADLAAEAELSGKEHPDPERVLGLLVPHAGLIYSGAIAALSWSLAAKARPDTIVIAGTDHQAWASGVGVWGGGAWLTPLGEVAVNQELAAAIASLGEPFARDDGAHGGEHSIEVQLPMVARLCPEAAIVPLAVSPRLRSHARAGAMLGRLLADRRARGERILLVASSDMAHYPPASICEATDEELLKPLLRLDGDALYALEGSVLDEGRAGLVCGLCGIDPVRVTLSALREMGATEGVLLGAATSADAGGDPGRTVGYAAAAFVQAARGPRELRDEPPSSS